ncbi:hypothetical protein BH09ACT5_BH09ACT5_06230 [soil metagenome]
MAAGHTPSSRPRLWLALGIVLSVVGMAVSGAVVVVVLLGIGIVALSQTGIGAPIDRWSSSTSPGREWLPVLRHDDPQ